MKITLVYGDQSVDLAGIQINPVTEASLSFTDADNNVVVMRTFATVYEAVEAHTRLGQLIETARLGGITIEIIIDDI